jgi:TATA-binding protein-associated factor
LAAFPEVIEILASETQSKPLSQLAPILFSFFRHTIPNVRLQVVTTLHAFLSVPDLPKDWISDIFLCLVFQNLILEERENVRAASFVLWKICIDILSQVENALQATVSSPLISDWFAIMLQPWGQALNSSLFRDNSAHNNGLEMNGDSKAGERHNVDKAILAQDSSLVSPEVIWQARLASAGAMGYLIHQWPSAEEAVRVLINLA